ncbi:MAG: hypothetical protein ACRCWY_06770 [Cellulosilyticaceae bacterium]
MKKRVLGLSVFCVGCGMILALVVPALGWIITTAAIFILLGYILVCG